MALSQEDFELFSNSQLEVQPFAYGPLLMRVHLRRWRYQEAHPHLARSLKNPLQARLQVERHVSNSRKSATSRVQSNKYQSCV